MIVRSLSDREDARGVLRVNALSWREAYSDLVPEEVLERQDPNPKPADVDRLLQALPEEGVVLVAVEEDTVRGFADFRWDEESTKEFVGPAEAGLRAIYVHPDDWGRGIGTALLAEGLSRLPDRIRAVRLEVLADNERAREFYQSRGFEQTGSDTHDIADTEYPTAIYTRTL
ncbi:GNAT family N-acetyltransferase [Halalkaliarchaeum sp. AArc-GB]|uniref:GNAT family N-acetyltransferase n=1 Tax=Halalkaliarchaeum sp. AArc-GB TaxID=3074078 RepID=UPI002859134B|nr:GNAT family N-acetyltransferase [Halalkaliarchaeum sp. AArc-GB]MDR5674587.1 GNAT family N-acetyltransferase [Halalkaliarchaeum sp. AArc-GB]